MQVPPVALRPPISNPEGSMCGGTPLQKNEYFDSQKQTLSLEEREKDSSTGNTFPSTLHVSPPVPRWLVLILRGSKCSGTPLQEKLLCALQTQTPLPLGGEKDSPTANTLPSTSQPALHVSPLVPRLPISILRGSKCSGTPLQEKLFCASQTQTPSPLGGEKVSPTANTLPSTSHVSLGSRLFRRG